MDEKNFGRIPKKRISKIFEVAKVLRAILFNAAVCQTLHLIVAQPLFRLLLYWPSNSTLLKAAKEDDISPATFPCELQPMSLPVTRCLAR